MTFHFLRFGIATQLSLTYTTWSADGVLGLAKKESSDPKDSKPILSALTSKLFQVHLAPCHAAGLCGSIAIGSKGLISAGICDGATSVPFTSNPDDWSFPITSFEIRGGKPLDKTFQVAQTFSV